MKEKDKLKIAEKNILRNSFKPKSYVSIKGYDFSQGLNYSKILDSFSTSGFQASNFSKAVEIIKEMRKQKCTIFLGYTSNMVTSGLRDVFRYLAEKKLVDVIVTTAGGIEEDIIKCFDDFILGDFNADGANLRQKGINRTGNIFVPNDRYIKFEKFFIPFLEELNKESNVNSTTEITKRLGEKINNKSSIYYWCYKNNIPVFCPALTDGSMGDMIYFFKHKHPELKIDIADDIKKLNDIAITSKKTGLIILGSGVIKHHICNANMFRNGADYAVYLNNSQEFDGSDAGARPEEAISWGKILPKAKHIKVFGDATILFPLIVAKTFIEN
ncbi:deoxyhypusine synthase [Candidatus Woesearchaeota archaeon]|nr:deoxyhypusine synthase [Candidatus Woesearchaeota archaeon]